MSAWLAKALVVLVTLVLAFVGIGVAAIETGWAKNRIRDLIVRQANEYLTATLTIGRLEGSLFRGLQLGDINLARGNRTLIHVDEISLVYSIRELIDRGTVGGEQPDEGGIDAGSIAQGIQTIANGTFDGAAPHVLQVDRNFGTGDVDAKRRLTAAR